MDVTKVTDISQTPDTSDIYKPSWVSDRELYVFQVINYYAINSIICLFGVVANVINMVVFYKQGFDNTMNISFFSLAISDLCSLVTSLWGCTVLSGVLDIAGFSMDTYGVAYLTGGHTRVCFARITSWITVFITAERCLCILLPLKIKQLITPRRTTIIISSIFILIIMSTEPEFQTAYLAWSFDITRNQTILALAFTPDRKNVEGVSFILYAILGFASFVCVVIFTLILVFKLKTNSKWRRTATNETMRSELTIKKESKTISMVVMIATVLIVCNTPSVILSVVTFIEPAFSINGHLKNEFFAFWSFVYIFEPFNSSVNIILYYYMSCRFRKTFQNLFCCRRLETKHNSLCQPDSRQCFK